LLVRTFLTKLAIKRPFSFPPHPMFVPTLPGESTTSEISFYAMPYDCVKTLFVYLSDTGADILFSLFFNCLQ